LSEISADAFLDQLKREFEGIVGLQLRAGKDYQRDARRLANYLSQQGLLPLETRRRLFLGHVNWKFRVNASGLRAFYGLAAKSGHTFNYHQKNQVQKAFDERQSDDIREVLHRLIADPSVRAKLYAAFTPVPEKVTIEILRAECLDPSKLRKPKAGRDVEREILEAQFAAFMFCSLPRKGMHRFFDPEFSEGRYNESFWCELHARHPHLFNREHALEVLRLPPAGQRPKAYEEFRDRVCGWMASAYERINNYGYLAVLVEPVRFDLRWRQWELASDLMLFGEKHREASLAKTYFRSKQIAETTSAYIPGIDARAARFELVNEGFTYKDCFVLTSAADADADVLLLLFQKNERDETPIPCPACRSQNVQGNSYPTLGVRSWECKNRLCPDRSKYNRGKRYSFKGIVTQQAIDEELNEIPVTSVRAWSRDVHYGKGLDDALNMLIRHYSLHDDAVHFYNIDQDVNPHGRRVQRHTADFGEGTPTSRFFADAAWFSRYIVDRQPIQQRPIETLGESDFLVYCGDAFEALRQLPQASVDGAVTSPPYYNAREYAQWDNIYCYLYDMYNIAAGVFRALRPGGLYLFNIFDYFDNERSIVFSAMGQRRMILSAYTVDMFRRLGFELIGNVAWDKGEIEGKRGFNAGNFSPYYQAPFNCWEHVLVFQKPGAANGQRIEAGDFPAVLKAQPIIKMVRGRNIHGHTAPFPEALPKLLIDQLPRGATILDPFGGSLTTGRVAERHGLLSIMIERSPEYCELGLAMRADEQGGRGQDCSPQPQQELPFDQPTPA
jgi:DNA modification methylase